MVWIAVLVLLATAVLGIGQRESSKTLESLQEINAAAINLSNVANTWDGNVGSANEVVASATVLVDSVDTANYDAAEEESISSEDSTAIISFISDAIEPSFLGSFNALVVRKGEFDMASISADILDVLRGLKRATDAFGTTLSVVVPVDQQDGVRSAIYQLDNDFSKIIDAFS